MILPILESPLVNALGPREALVLLTLATFGVVAIAVLRYGRSQNATAYLAVFSTALVVIFVVATGGLAQH